MTVAVMTCVGGLAIGFVALGGANPTPPPTQLVILTAPPAALTQAALPAGEIAPPQGAATRSAADGALMMVGPTLPAVVFTPTPQQIAQGITVVVVDVGDQQLNVRERPGIVDVAIAFRAPEGTRFFVGDGPSQADGLTWWRIDDPATGRTGWAASNYLQPIVNP
jgi:hypothetical protein